MRGGCPTFCLFYALPRDAFCKCTSDFARRARAHSELLWSLVSNLKVKLRACLLVGSRVSPGLGGVWALLAVSFSARLASRHTSFSQSLDLQVLCPPEASADAGNH